MTVPGDGWVDEWGTLLRTLQHALRRRLFAGAAAVAVAMAYVQVTSVPSPTGRQTHYTWNSFFSDVRGDLRATVNGIRRERDERTAIINRMRHDVQVLDQTLSDPGPNRFG
jgi:hypothetical protein